MPVKKKIDFLNKDKKSSRINNTNTVPAKIMRKKKQVTKTTDSGSKKSTNAVKSKSSRKPTTRKSSTVTNSIVPKRRGRRPKKILETVNENSEELSEDSNGVNDSAVILKLPFDPARIDSIRGKKKVAKKNSPVDDVDSIDDVDLDDANDTDDSDDANESSVDSDDDQSTESTEGMFINDIPQDNICHKCEKNNKLILTLRAKLDRYEKKENFDRSIKTYTNNLRFVSITNGKKIQIKKTNIKCWWDSYSFKGLPCFLPELFNKNTYHVRGCFCSFNCALAYNLYYIKDSKVHHRKSLINKLYREMHDLAPEEIVDIKEAPPKEILTDFGGNMPIDVFRRSFIAANKEYIVYMPPIKPINLVIEERDTEIYDDDSDKEYVLKRSKPLTKKRSVIASMKKAQSSSDDK